MKHWAVMARTWLRCVTTACHCSAACLAVMRTPSIAHRNVLLRNDVSRFVHVVWCRYRHVAWQGLQRWWPWMRANGQALTRCAHLHDARTLPLAAARHISDRVPCVACGRVLCGPRQVADSLIDNCAITRKHFLSARGARPDDPHLSLHRVWCVWGEQTAATRACCVTLVGRRSPQLPCSGSQLDRGALFTAVLSGGGLLEKGATVVVVRNVPKLPRADSEPSIVRQLPRHSVRPPLC